MEAIEFQTFSVDGAIEVPESLREKIKGQLRVIVLLENEDINYLDYLMQNPIQDPDFVPLTRDEIYSRKRFGD